MVDHSRDRIKDISRQDVATLVDELLMELHMDCSKKIDPDIFTHTTKKFTNLLIGQFSSWYWGEVLSVTKMGLSGSYGPYANQLNFQSLYTWMKKAQQSRSANYADKSIEEAKLQNNSIVGDFKNISHKWKEFRQYMENEGLWFIDNISEKNCNHFHEAKQARKLQQFKDGLVQIPDPEYLKRMREMTLEQFKTECNVFNAV